MKELIKKILRESIKETMGKKQPLNELYWCYCRVKGKGIMQCHANNGQETYLVGNAGCCGSGTGSPGNQAHPTCQDRSCDFIENSTCLDNVVNPGGGGHENPAGLVAKSRKTKNILIQTKNTDLVKGDEINMVKEPTKGKIYPEFKRVK